MHDPDWPRLHCTRCGGDLYIELVDEGSMYSSWRVVDSISCEKCGAEWDRHGQPRPVAWLAELD